MSILRRTWTIQNADKFKIGNELPYADRDYIAGVIYSASNPKVSTDPLNVASVIASRSKELQKHPMEVISYGFTEVGGDSKAKFEPFLKKDYSKGTPQLVDESYKLADQVLTGNLENATMYNSFHGDKTGTTNTFYKQKLSTDSWADPSIIRSRFTQSSKLNVPASISIAIPAQGSMPFKANPPTKVK